MKRRRMAQVIPALFMAGAASVPLVTTVEILTHVPGGGSMTPFQPSGQVAALPSRPSPRAARSLAPTSSGGSQTFQGPVINDPFGGVQATIAVAGKKITNVAISAPMDSARSASINQQAIPLLQSETLQAQSAQINTVSGATFTSQAYAQSLQAALDQARSKGSLPTGAAASSRSAGGSSAQISTVSSSGDDN